MELEEADANVALDSEVAFCFSPLKRKWMVGLLFLCVPRI
jgi:hypothetical protein